MVRRFEKTTAVEAGAAAAGDLRFNAERAGVAVDVQQTSVDDYLSNVAVAPEFVMADPPRAGLGKRAVEHLVRLSPPRITIVACDPATLARDLAGLIAGGYLLDRLTMIDLFPQTFHIEAIAELRKG
jgi:23S rRNA (uracil1939-C5)-methyltransferase